MNFIIQFMLNLNFKLFVSPKFKLPNIYNSVGVDNPKSRKTFCLWGEFGHYFWQRLSTSTVSLVWDSSILGSYKEQLYPYINPFSVIENISFKFRQHSKLIQFKSRLKRSRKTEPFTVQLMPLNEPNEHYV